MLILGDLTDAKDNHPAELTNRIVDELAKLSRTGLQVTILGGNHDYLKQGHAYFAFLSHVPGVRFITKPTELDNIVEGGPACFALPHSKNPAAEWAGLDFSHYDYLFMHQTVSGSVASNGQKMEGEELPPLNAGKVYSGDIHVPQVIKGVEYVGSPYHVHFGDNFKPRCVLIDRRRRSIDLHFETISRRTIRISGMAGVDRLRTSKSIKPGDQVKLVIELGPEERYMWSRIRRSASEAVTEAGGELMGADLQSIEPGATRRAGSPPGPTRRRIADPDAIQRFVERDELGGDALEIGLNLIGG